MSSAPCFRWSPAPEPGRVTVLSTDLTETAPLERRADSVLQADAARLPLAGGNGTAGALRKPGRNSPR